MDNHVELGYELSDVLELYPSRIHYQPGPKTSLTYPCALFEPETPGVVRANNKAYLINDCYKVTHIYKDRKNSKRKEMLEHFRYISCNNVGMIVDGLYHDYYTIYY